MPYPALLRRISRVVLPARPRTVAMTTVVCTILATTVRELLDPLMPLGGVPYFTFWFAVDAATVVAGWRAGVLTLVTGALVGWFAWIPPRGSFELTQEGLAVVVVFVLLATPQVVLAELMRQALTSMQRALDDRQLMIAELSHRMKNQFSVFSAIARTTLRDAATVAEARSKLDGRIAALSSALALAVADRHGAEMTFRELAKVVLAPLAPGVHRLAIHGHNVPIVTERGQLLALILHELATNAIKYGAWSHDDGRVDVTATVSDSSFELTWREDGVRRAEDEDPRRGAGTTLIERAIVGAQVTVDRSGPLRIVQYRVPLVELTTVSVDGIEDEPTTTVPHPIGAS